MIKKCKVSLLSFLLLGFLAMFLNTGCLHTRPVKNPDFTVKLAPKEYEILGRVVYKGTMHNLFGLISWGGAAYNKLYEKAKNEFDADDVVNVSVDYETWAIGGLYNSRSYVMTGIAIKYKK